jgi:hypothetical protein
MRTFSADNKCTGKLEIAAVIDSSRSIADDQFIHLQDFVKGFVDIFDIFGPAGIQVYGVQHLKHNHDLTMLIGR